MLAVYVSGHGYGHATRTAEVLRALRAHARQLRIVVSTSAPRFLFEAPAGAPLELRPSATDVGLVQKDALEIDAEATVAAWRAFTVGWEACVTAEACWLRAAGARLVLGDIPPLAFAAAAAAGIPSVALGNFSWDWIYAHLSRHHPALGGAAAWAREAYRRTTLLLRLPFAGDLSAFHRVEDVPFVARRPMVDKREARKRLGLDARPAVLFSFGGIGMSRLGPGALQELSAYQVLLTGRVDDSRRPAHVRVLDAAALETAGLSYPDLVGASDVVVTKPGYGIVTDCIAARTRLVYTERGDFPEYPIMVAEMGRYLPAVHASNEAVREGRLEKPLAEVLAMPFPGPPDLNGAAAVASRLLDFVSKTS